MSDLTPAAFQRRLAAEFEARGWHYDLNIGRTIVEEIERRGSINPAQVAEIVPGEFLARSGADRADVAAAIEAAAGGQNVKAEPPPASVIIDNRYQINVSGKSQIKDSRLNVGEGTQINVDIQAEKSDVLAAVEALLRSGLVGDWNNRAAVELAKIIDTRDDIDLDDVRELTKEVVLAEQPKQGRVREFLSQVAAGGFGGVLSTGLSAGIGEIISQLPL